MGGENDVFEKIGPPGKMRWDSMRMIGVPYAGRNGSQSLNDFMDPEWEEVTEKQKFCGDWESHWIKGGDECLLCGAKKLR